MKNDRDEKEMTVEKVYVTWNDIERFISALAISTNNFANFNGVYGPARGGLIFSVIISERYNLPFLGAPQKDCIVVDDIVDSGDTALSWKDKGYYVATMYYKDRAKVTPDFYYSEKEDKWIVFPWESKE